ncbi:MAG: gliding motility-associated ABC transporter substrate-binding protein GldG, partial [Bacteroidetes bacterium]|nr:gliding motility-associated ABC transporter substrate-binding protein GldG [Bacteroidota bacterium]
NLANTIRKLASPEKRKIGILTGQGELPNNELMDIMNALSETYEVSRVKIGNQLNSLQERDTQDTNHVFIKNKFRAIIVAKPDSIFDEKDKFLIDQFIMRGGRVLWLIDPVFASMDSLQTSNETMGIAQNLGLEDMLFHYGVRLNSNLLLDLNACPIPVKTGQIGNQPQFEFYPWYFSPLVAPTINHPIINNLNAIKFEFVSSLDTVVAEQVRKTILLKTSGYTRSVNAPALISLELLKKKPDIRSYPGPPRPVAVLLEGKFSSLYQHRIPPEIAENKGIGFKEQGDSTKMIVVSDGDIIKNFFDHKRGVPYPCGYDRYTRETFGNKDFILNCMDYLCDDSGLISVRSREVKLRLLDGNKVQKDKLFLQLLNILLPILLVILYGVFQTWSRRRRYGITH